MFGNHAKEEESRICKRCILGKEKRTLLDLLGSAEILHKVASTVVQAVLNRGGTLDHITRFLKERGRWMAVAAVIMAPSVQVDPLEDLPADHYRVTTTGIVPEFVRLNGELFTWASPPFNGCEWLAHTANLYADMSPNSRVFFAKHFDKKMTSEEAIAWGEANGYRVATHAEAIDFAAAYPDLQRQYPLVALGSFAVHGDSRYVVVLSGDSGGRYLDSDWFGSECGPVCRFLFVRK